jgi:glutamate-1-semialdehyde 2,1-aminomutase
MNPNGEAYHLLLKQYTPNGCQTLSKMPSRFVEVYPKVLERGLDGHVWDADGKEYIDLIAGLGCISVGYADIDVNERVIEQVNSGVSFSLPNKLEYLAARRLTELVPGTEMWKFGKNGTDGTVMAVRAARAITGRDRIMTVGYNGCADVFECQGTRNAGIPISLKADNTRARFNEIDDFFALASREYACVLMEPMVYDYPAPGFLARVKELCYRSGTLLIFDEVVNGGRFDGFTSHSRFNVKPDLVVMGKGIANGFPLCAVGGTRRLMSVFERDDFFASGTFGGECVSLAALVATQTKLPTAIPKMISHGRRIQEAFNKLAWPSTTVCKGYPTRLIFQFPTSGHKALFMQEMCVQGILVGAANFIMASHTDEDVTKIIEAIFGSYKTLKYYWDKPTDFLKGPLPEDALKTRN